MNPAEDGDCCRPSLASERRERRYLRSALVSPPSLSVWDGAILTSDQYDLKQVADLRRVPIACQQGANGLRQDGLTE
jgi:hypothetical protein